mmetsp:Transcript_13964/g.48657  ORF Transcript_13964/g.48657 Transcript_13964/m.48657 type:complete len:236 (-) Transcript_13964:1596-2303(-)
MARLRAQQQRVQARLRGASFVHADRLVAGQDRRHVVVKVRDGDCLVRYRVVLRVVGRRDREVRCEVVLVKEPEGEDVVRSREHDRFGCRPVRWRERHRRRHRRQRGQRGRKRSHRNDNVVDGLGRKGDGDLRLVRVRLAVVRHIRGSAALVNLHCGSAQRHRRHVIVNHRHSSLNGRGQVILWVRARCRRRHGRGKCAAVVDKVVDGRARHSHRDVPVGVREHDCGRAQTQARHS